MADNLDKLSDEDFAALHEMQTQLTKSGDPRAAKLQQYIDTQAPAPTAEHGIVGRAWDWMNKGLISGDTLLNIAGKLNAPAAAVSRAIHPDDKSNPQAGESGSDYVKRMASAGPDPDHPIMRAAQVGLAGAARDTAATASSFTSPLSVGTMAAGAATKLPGAVGTVAKVAAPMIATGFAGKGAVDVAENAGAAVHGDPDATQKTLMGGAMVAGGAAGLKGTTPEVQQVAAKGISRAGVEAVLQPVGKQFRFGKDPTGFVIDNGITANSLEELHNSIQSVVNDKTTQLDAALKQSPATVDLAPAKKVITESIKEAMQKRDAATVGKLTQLYQTLSNRIVPGQSTIKSVPSPGSIPAWEAAQVKRGVQQSINWAETADKPINDVKLQVQHAIGEGLHQAVPETAALDESISSGIEAQKSAERQWQNQQAGKRTVRNGTRVPMVGAAIGGAVGGAPGAAIGATVGRGIVQGMAEPAVGTRMGNFERMFNASGWVRDPVTGRIVRKKP